MIDLLEIFQSAKDFCEIERPQPETLLSPFLTAGSRTLLIGPRGCGKTWLGLGIAQSVAMGFPFFDGTRDTIWTASRPRGVAYIDGESSGYLLEKRARLLGLDQCSSLTILSTCEQGKTHPEILGLNLADQDTQDAILYTLNSLEPALLVVDNLACLYRNGDPNGAEAWGPLKRFLVSVSALEDPPAVLLIAHAGKDPGRGIRGSSAAEDLVDTVLELAPRKAKDGETRLVVQYTKYRDFHGADTEPVGVAFLDGRFTRFPVGSSNDEADCKNAKREAKARNRKEAVAEVLNGDKVVDVARRHGVVPGTVYRWLHEEEQKKSQAT